MNVHVALVSLQVGGQTKLYLDELIYLNINMFPDKVLC